MHETKTRLPSGGTEGGRGVAAKRQCDMTGLTSATTYWHFCYTFRTAGCLGLSNNNNNNNETETKAKTPTETSTWPKHVWVFMSACQFSLLTCCFWPPPSPSHCRRHATPHSCLLFRIPHSSVRSPFSVLLLNSTFATQYGKCHLFLMAFWHLPLLNMFACSPLRSLSPPSSSSFCFSVALPQTTLMYFQFCGFSFAFLFHFLFAFSSRFEGATSVPESQLSYLSPASALAPVEAFFTFSLTNSVLVVFSVAFDKPITFILIWLLCFRMCFMPETSWNVSCISFRFDVALKAKLYLRTFSNMLIESQLQFITKLSVNEHN